MKLTRKEYDRYRYKNNPVRNKQCKERVKSWAKENKEYLLQYQKDYHKRVNATPEGKLKLRKHVLKRHGLTYEDYDKMYLAQNGICAICSKIETAKDRYGNPRRLNVDHNHRTNKNRGLLCMKCNSAIGKLQADNGTQLLQSAIKYIRSYGDY